MVGQFPGLSGRVGEISNMLVTNFLDSRTQSVKDEEAIVEPVKQHEELYNKTNDSFKDKQKKENTLEAAS